MSPEDNERLTRVGPGTPGGIFMRRYWQAALLSRELPEPDGAPVRVRILGEDLLAFRDTEGRVGIVDAYCPHRRAPLFYGRIEECGVRCTYHGFKFDRMGNPVDLPSEPKDSPIYQQIRLPAYPVHEAGGIVWVYMGPAAQMPAPPDYEWMRAPETHRFVSKTIEHCNFLQGLEGGLDTAHVSYLHQDDRNAVTQLASMDGAPKLEVKTNRCGYSYLSRRQVGGNRAYLRLYQYVMPAQQMRPSIVTPSGAKQEVPSIDGHLWVPIDDETTAVYNFIYSYDPEMPLPRAFVEAEEAFFGRGPEDFIPGTFELRRNVSNDHLIDRSLQKKGNYSGIVGINTQDYALQEGMGKIVDRSKEFLTQTDRAIVAMRQMMLRAIRAAEAGEAPPGASPEEHRDVRAFEDIVPPETTMAEMLAYAKARF